MAAPQLGSYSSSTALSPQHYKLVRQVEQARTAEDTNRVLLDCLVTIKTSWAKRAPSPSTARHDLVLVLYARSQRAQPLARPLDPVAEELFEAAWALPVAVKLAGGAGRADLTNRNLGYRACTELFSPLEPHSLKLLLVNTIRSDLYAPLGTDKAEARWASSLRAAASPALASPELAPAVRERVLELMLDRHYSNPIRRLALETLLSLARCTADNTSSRPTSLVAEARNAVLTLVLPPPPSASSSAAGRSGRGRSSTPRRPDLSLAFLAALASALSPSSPLHPVVPDAAQRVELGVQLCRRILAAPEEDEPRTRYKGVRGLWVTERALKVLRDELGQAVAADAGHDARGEAAVRELVWELVEKMLETANEASDAVLLSALSLLPFLSTALPAGSPDSPTLRRLLSHLHSHLVRRSSPVALLFALRALAHLPPTTWATVDDDKGKARDDDASASGGTPWGEPAWSSILAGLDDPDSTVRRATLALLTRVDAKLVEIQYERLLALASAPESVGVDSGRSTSSLASGRSSSGKRRPMSRTLERVLEVLPFLSPAPTSSPAPSSSTLPLAQRLLALLARPELGLEATTVLPGLVVRVLHAFQYAPLEAQRSFAHEILFGEGGEWKQGVVAGLWAAGTVHAFEQDEAGKAEEMLGKWLTQDQGSTNPDLVALLQEPFLFALLRLLALHPGLDIPSTLSNDLARAAARAVSPETARLFSVVKQCISPADSHVLATLHAVAARTRPAPLGEFGAALLAALDAHDGAPEPTPPPRPGPSASSRLHHPPPAPSSAPLRYSYSPPRSPVEAPRPDSASAALARSSAALAREQADLLRERSERGGRGARKGEPVETIKTPRLRVGELRDESDGEEERVREEEDSSGGRARGEAEEDVGETSGEIELWQTCGNGIRIATPLGLNHVRAASDAPQGLGAHFKGNLLPGTNDDEVLNERAATFHLALFADRCASASTGWPCSISDIDITTVIPNMGRAYPRGDELTASPLSMHNPSFFVAHPPHLVGPQQLFFKAVVLLGKTCQFNARAPFIATTSGAGSALNEAISDLRRTDAFKRTNSMIHGFISSIPREYQFQHRPLGSGAADVLTETRLCLVHGMAHASMILLHEPYVATLDDDEPSLQQCVASANEILRSIFLILGTSYEIALFSPFISYCWACAGRTFIRQIGIKQVKGLTYGVDELRSNVETILVVLKAHRTPLGDNTHDTLKVLLERPVSCLPRPFLSFANTNGHLLMCHEPLSPTPVHDQLGTASSAAAASSASAGSAAWQQSQGGARGPSGIVESPDGPRFYELSNGSSSVSPPPSAPSVGAHSHGRGPGPGSVAELDGAALLREYGAGAAGGPQTPSAFAAPQYGAGGVEAYLQAKAVGGETAFAMPSPASDWYAGQHLAGLEQLLSLQ